jgi:hypothetical protein
MRAHSHQWHGRHPQGRGTDGMARACIAALAVLLLASLLLGPIERQLGPSEALAEGDLAVGDHVTAHVVPDSYQGNTGWGASRFKVYIDGVEYQGYCYESFVGDPNHDFYPAPGEGDYMGTVTDAGVDGWYSLLIDSSAATNYAPWAPPSDWPHQKVIVARFTRIPGTAAIHKTSADPSLTDGNGCYSLEGIEYGVYSDEACTDLVGTITLDEHGKGSIEVPEGTYYMREGDVAGSGYLRDGTVHAVKVRSGETSTVEATDVPADAPSGAIVQKLDAEGADLGAEAAKEARGASTLAGAEFTVRYFDNTDGDVSGEPARTWVFRTDDSGKVRYGSDWYESGDELYIDDDGNAIMPMGTYSVQETKAPEGYCLSDDSAHVAVVSPGDDGSASWRNLDGWDQANADEDFGGRAVADQVVRGDFSATKAELEGQRRMAGVPFLVTSQTTGEAHVVVTDENGMVDTSASLNPHTHLTNANDAAYDVSTGKVDEDELDPSAGVWFSGSAGSHTKPDDSRGALPFDTYTVEELRCSANADVALVGFSVRISRDGRTIDLGTIQDGPLGITTVLTSDGAKAAPAASEAELEDEVAYQGLEAGYEYVLKGEIHLVDEEGSDGGVIATGESTFTAQASSGEEIVSFTVDTSDLGGRSLVAYERLYEGDTLIASHEDISDEGQTVTVPVPQLRTTMTGESGHEEQAAGSVMLTDAVSYEGLVPGQRYVVSGRLMDRSTGEPLVVDGREVTATTEFTPEDPDGTVEVTFEFDASKLAGRELVAFENLADDEGHPVASHEDIDNSDQTVRLTGRPSMPQTGSGFVPFALIFVGAGIIAFAARKRS